MKITPKKFYKLFLKEINKRKILCNWDNSKEWTKLVLKDRDCVMAKIAKSLGLLYCNEYFSLDGIFYRKKLGYKNWNIRENYYAQNIEVIIEHENNPGTLKTEIYKLIPLFLAPLKVIITYTYYAETGKNIQYIEKIKSIIKERINSDDVFFLHKNKIKTLLIVGFKKDNKIFWQGSVFKKGRFIVL